MPEDPKKHDKKQAKEQRKPRQRHQQAKAEKRPEKAEEPTSAPKVTVPQKPPVYESPPPEFFKNLKRETDEILKITKEENTKYKKKEIQSNWSKYEVPIESYDEIDEQENMGADYEKLIEAPLSLGGHFQFKHEKSWDINTGPSPYDKYFEINMEDLNIALCTIPFLERNSIEQSAFSETDIMTMNNRSTRFKQKYYNDKSYSTPEIEAQDKILNSLRDSMKSEDNTIKSADICNKDICNKDIEIKSENDNKISSVNEENRNLATDINLKLENESLNTVDSNKINEENKLNDQNIATPKVEPIVEINESLVESVEHDDFIFGNTEKLVKSATELIEVPNTKVSDVTVAPQMKFKKPPAIETNVAPIETKVTPIETKVTPIENKVTPNQTKITPVVATVTQSAAKVADTNVESKKNPVIESPEDLEKWLDDFLDG